MYTQMPCSFVLANVTSSCKQIQYTRNTRYSEHGPLHCSSTPPQRMMLVSSFTDIQFPLLHRRHGSKYYLHGPHLNHDPLGGGILLASVGLGVAVALQLQSEHCIHCLVVRSLRLAFTSCTFVLVLLSAGAAALCMLLGPLSVHCIASLWTVDLHLDGCRQRHSTVTHIHKSMCQWQEGTI